MTHVSGITAAFVAAALSIGCSDSVSPTSPAANVSPGVSIGAPGISDPAVPGAPGGQQVRLTGSLEGTVTLDFTNFPAVDVFIAATGHATQLGRFTVEIPHVVDFNSATGTGTFDFVAANGDRLTAEFTGQADTSTPIFAIREVATITGGTGRFAGATGSFIANRLYDTAAGTTTGTFEGTISIPRGAR
jgi:hypothetical protein